MFWLVLFTSDHVFLSLHLRLGLTALSSCLYDCRSVRLSVYICPTAPPLPPPHPHWTGPQTDGTNHHVGRMGRSGVSSGGLIVGRREPVCSDLLRVSLSLSATLALKPGPGSLSFRQNQSILSAVKVHPAVLRTVALSVSFSV